MSVSIADVAIIGAGPAGSVAASILAARGHSVCVLENAHFPRFSIGESLLPQAMEFLAAADLLDDVHAAGFQLKNGAVFRRSVEERVVDFADKSYPGWATTYQVERSRFDSILAEGARRKGAELHFGTSIVNVALADDRVSLRARTAENDEQDIIARFVLDASGFGRVLPRFLELEQPSAFEERQSLFTHVRDNMPADTYDRNKILISVHPLNAAIWYWLIPLSNGVSSIGVVGRIEDIDAAGETDKERFWHLIGRSGRMADLLADAQPFRPIGKISGYARGVKTLSGPGYALLGNAAEFLDPIFSSGVTIALKSATLACDVLDRQLRNKPVNWQDEFVAPLCQGIEVFRAFVNAWYDESLQRIIFRHAGRQSEIKRMIVSVLAGYVWDQSNPLVQQPQRYLSMLSQL